MDNLNFAENRPASSTPEGPVLPWPEFDGEVAHGYTLAQVNRMAVYAARKSRWVDGMDLRDRAEAAQSAITEYLLTADEEPEAAALIAIAWQAMKAAYAQDLQSHGRGSQDRSQPCAAFNAYWWSTASATHSLEEAVVDHLAFWQVWDTLDAGAQEAVRAIAAHATPAKAAVELGVAYNTFGKRLRSARDAFRALWHEGEEIPPRWGYDRPNARISPRRAMDLLRQRKRKRDQRAADPNPPQPRRLGAPRIEVGVPSEVLLARHENGETQVQLAQELGVSKNVIRARINEARQQRRRKSG